MFKLTEIDVLQTKKRILRLIFQLGFEICCRKWVAVIEFVCIWLRLIRVISDIWLGIWKGNRGDILNKTWKIQENAESRNLHRFVTWKAVSQNEGITLFCQFPCTSQANIASIASHIHKKWHIFCINHHASRRERVRQCLPGFLGAGFLACWTGTEGSAVSRNVIFKRTRICTAGIIRLEENFIFHEKQMSAGNMQTCLSSRPGMHNARRKKEKKTRKIYEQRAKLKFSEIWKTKKQHTHFYRDLSEKQKTRTLEETVLKS